LACEQRLGKRDCMDELPLSNDYRRTGVTNALITFARPYLLSNLSCNNARLPRTRTLQLWYTDGQSSLPAKHRILVCVISRQQESNQTMKCTAAGLSHKGQLISGKQIMDSSAHHNELISGLLTIITINSQSNGDLNHKDGCVG